MAVLSQPEASTAGTHQGSPFPLVILLCEERGQLHLDPDACDFHLLVTDHKEGDEGVYLAYLDWFELDLISLAEDPGAVELGEDGSVLQWLTPRVDPDEWAERFLQRSL